MTMFPEPFEFEIDRDASIHTTYYFPAPMREETDDYGTVTFTNVDQDIVDWIRACHEVGPSGTAVIFNGVLKEDDGPRP